MTENLFASLKNIVATIIAILHTRLALLSSDIEVARERLVSVLMFVFASFLFIFMGIASTIIFIIVLFWDTHKLLALGGLSFILLAIGLLLWRHAIRTLHQIPRCFDASLNELIKDHDQLSSHK